MPTELSQGGGNSTLGTAPQSASGQSKGPRRAFFLLQELLGSMRFAIALLTLISIASVIGTILKQQEPFPNYVNQFGPFWARVFRTLGLFEVYTAWWFLLILAFLLISVSLCLIRNAPKMVTEAMAWKDHVQEGGMKALHHHFYFETPAGALESKERLIQYFVKNGYKLKTKEGSTDTLIVAKKGSANKWGYILAHSAIILICLGGLLDGDLATRAQIWWGGKEYLPPSLETARVADIPQKHKLEISNPSYRANLYIPEGQQSSVAYINGANGGLLQELPFSVKLKQFKVDYYSTGMPKLFSSEVLVTDLKTGKEQEALIKVNEPFIVDGNAIYQSSFEDGGSSVTLQPYFLNAKTTNEIAHAIPLQMQVGSSASLEKLLKKDFQIEVTGFKLINVENLTNADGKSDARGVAKEGQENFGHSLSNRFGSGAKVTNAKELRNVGPSIQYKVRDSAGQAKEFSNYMSPFLIDGQAYFLAGVREQVSEPFKYLRIPADAEGTLKEWLVIQSLLGNERARNKAVIHFASKVSAAGDAATRQKIKMQLEQSALKAIDVFANGFEGTPGGFTGVTAFIEKAVPEAEREQAANVIVKILNGVFWQLWEDGRSQLNLGPAPRNEASEKFVQASMGALSDTWFYPLPVIFQLKEFDQVQASVFQVTKAPGKKWVYVGCLFLVLGIFAMFYLPERRIWIRLKNTSQSGLFAMTSTRQTMDFEEEFEKYRQGIQAWKIN